MVCCIHRMHGVSYRYLESYEPRFGWYLCEKKLTLKFEMQGECINCMRSFDMIAGCTGKNELNKNCVDLKLWSHKVVTSKVGL